MEPALFLSSLKDDTTNGRCDRTCHLLKKIGISCAPHLFRLLCSHSFRCRRILTTACARWIRKNKHDPNKTRKKRPSTKKIKGRILIARETAKRAFQYTSTNR
nr:hypothetical protein [Pandoravirus massiliensis]